MLSLTGYGRGQAARKAFSLEVECQTVNRKQFEIQVSGPRELLWLEAFLVEVSRPLLQRGRAQFLVRLQTAETIAPLGDQDLEAVRALLRQVGQAAQSVDVYAAEQDTTSILWALDKLSRDRAPIYSDETVDLLKELLSAAANEALQGVIAMRQAEGEQLRRELEGRLIRLRELWRTIQIASPKAPLAYRDLLLERLRLMGMDLDLADDRVLREISLYADRCDISEEITRLDSHLHQFAGALEEADEPVGRKLDFLCQELHREFNTIGSKTTLPEVTRDVIDAKQEVEKIREQAQNVL